MSFAVVPSRLLASGVTLAGLDGTQTVGEARMRVLFRDVCAARLQAPRGSFCDDQPFALALTYLRALDGEQIGRFFLDGELIGRVDEPGFTQAFFSIWLGEATSEPRLREQLLGVRP